MREVAFDLSDWSFLGETLAEYELRAESSKAQAFEGFVNAKLANSPARAAPALPPSLAGPAFGPRVPRYGATHQALIRPPKPRSVKPWRR